MAWTSYFSCDWCGKRSKPQARYEDLYMQGFRYIGTGAPRDGETVTMSKCESELLCSLCHTRYEAVVMQLRGEIKSHGQ